MSFGGMPNQRFAARFAAFMTMEAIFKTCGIAHLQ